MTPITWNTQAAQTGETDPMDLLARAELADWALLRTVCCLGFVTLLLASAGSLMS